MSVEGTYGDIFGTTVDTTVAKTIENIVKFREIYLEI